MLHIEQALSAKHFTAPDTTVGCSLAPGNVLTEERERERGESARVPALEDAITFR